MSDSIEFKLLGFWHLAHELYGIQVDVASRTLFEEIAQRLAEPHRKYHTAAHIVQASHSFTQFWGADNQIRQPGDGLFAMVLHDIVYEVGASDNELRSADFAKEKLPSIGVELPAVELVAEIIELTAGHRYEGDNQTIKACLDADMSILGKPPESYREYVSNLREEYRAYSDDQWMEGRSAFLQATLNSPIYLTKIATEMYCDQAQRNLQEELNSLRAGEDGV